MRRVLTQVAGAIDADTVWTAEDSPYDVTGDITVSSHARLTIESGVVVRFQENRGLTVRGQLVAEGTPWQRIVMDRAPGASDWNGIAFDDSLHDNRITYTDMRYGDDQGEAINVDHSRLLLDNLVWSGTTGTILELDHPSLIVRNSRFPTSQGGEIIHGEQIAGDEYLIIQGNVFANSNNGGDVIDFLGAERPGPVIQVLNNTFLGGGDDGLDLDGTDAHIEGNLFMNFRKNTGRNTTANAIATGLPQNGDPNRTEVTIVRNVFVNNDHALLLKEEAFADMQNNVFVGSTQAVIQFNEIGGTAVLGVARGAALEGNIFWNNARLFKNLVNQPEFKTELTVDHSLLPNEVVDFGGESIEAHTLGQNNLDGDPRFVDADGGNYRLLSDSPAIGRAAAGLDMGAHVAALPVLVPAPENATATSSASYTVAGPGIAHYRFRLNDAPYGALTPVETPIELTDLATGDYQLDVIGMNSAGEWSVGSTNAFDERAMIIAPQRARLDEMLPLVVQVRDGIDRVNASYTAPLSLDNAAELADVQLQVKKGVGSASPIVTATGDFSLSLPASGLPGDAREIQILDNTFPKQDYSGTLIGDNVWDATIERHITDDLLIPSGSTLTIQPGTRILLGDRVNLEVEGRIASLGTVADPVLFNSLERQRPWGGIELRAATGELSVSFFTNGGADTNRVFGHSNSQPVIKAVDSTLTCDQCFVINNVGKAFGSRNSEVTIDHSVVSHVDTGGEFSSSITRVLNSWVMNIADEEREFTDDDNDGFYFAGAHASGEPSRIENSFVIDTKDDAIDHNGAMLQIAGSWFEGAFHEGIAASNENWVSVTDSVLTRNNQGVEAGYGEPNVSVSRSVIVRNDSQLDPASQITAGLRFGDGYDGRQGAYEGHVSANHLVLFGNGDNVRNYDGSIPGPQAGAIDIVDSLTNDADVDDQTGNAAGIPVFGPRMHLLRGSAGFESGPDGLPLGREIPSVSARFSMRTRGDFDGNGSLDAEDINLFCGQLHAEDPDERFDLTGEGQVTAADRDELVLNVMNTTYGDSNLDGVFDSSDLVRIFQLGEYEDGIVGNSGWAAGDWNCDGEFSSSDLVLAFRAGGFQAAARPPASPPAQARDRLFALLGER